MKNQLVLLFMASLFTWIAPSFAAEYAVDGAHSHVGFQIRHLFSKTSGEFKKFDGSFNFDANKVDASKVQFTIQSESINTNNDDRDKHLRTAPDLLDTKKFPTITFTSKKITAAGEKKFKLEGDFTLHGITKPVTFDVEFLGADKDPWGTQKAAYTATTQINRKDFGITFNKVLESGRVMVGEEVTITVDVEGNEKKSK